MREVLISIQPKWVEKICRGEKTVEVRKTKPNCEVPFKCYIYETQGRTETPFVDEEGHYIFKGRGQVVAEFVCDSIYGIINFLPYDGEDFHHDIFPCVLEQTCLEDYEIDEYLGEKDGYGWHITDLVVYDKPRELSEFKYHCRYEFDDDFKHCDGCGYHHFSNTPSSGREEWCGCDGLKRLERPPQSWCYVESEGGE